MRLGSILALDQNDPNLSVENLYNNTIFTLEELKSKPWISNEILTKIRKRDKPLYKYSNAKDLRREANLLKDYKSLRNSITRFQNKALLKNVEIHKDKTASIWKGIRSFVKFKYY